MEYDDLKYDEAFEGIRCPSCGAKLESIDDVGHWTEPTYDNAPCWVTEGWLYRCPECGAEFITKEEI